MSIIRSLFDITNGSIIAKKTKNKLGSVLARGKQRIRINNGELKFENRVFLYPNTRISVDGVNKKAILEIGEYTQIGDRTEIHVGNKVSIGKNCAISWDVCILDRDYHYFNSNKEEAKEIIIEDNVWIGCRATILKGVKIGKGSVIAANSVVTKDVPERCCVAGNPAKVIKENIYWK